MNPDIYNEQLEFATGIASYSIAEFKNSTFYNSLEQKILPLELNRRYLHENLKNLQCYNFLEAMRILINCMFIRIAQKYGENPISQIHMGLPLQQWLDPRVQISATETGAFFAGFNYLEKVFVFKHPKNALISIPVTVETSDSRDFYTLIEYVIGLKLNKVRKFVPNFMFTYSLLYEQKNPSRKLLVEYIDGKEFKQFVGKIDNTKDGAKILYHIIYQIIMALWIAYEKVGFTHRDFHLSNILIKKIPTSAVWYHDSYMIVNFVPIIIDYGLSSVRIDGERFIGVDIKNIQGEMSHMSRKHGQQMADIIKMYLLLLLELKILNKNIVYDELVNIFDKLFYKVLINTRDSSPHSTPTPPPSVVKGVQLNDNLMFNISEKAKNSRITLKELCKDAKKLVENSIYKIETKRESSGFHVYNRQNNCEDVKNVLKKMVNLPDVSGPCGSDPWLKLENWTDRYGRSRYWYDCGEFYFDGTFNVVKFPKGMSLYHGSKTLAENNAEFPIGKDYYDSTKGPWIINDEIKNLFNTPGITAKKIKRGLNKNAPINQIYYSDINVAREYSGRTTSRHSCGEKCVFAFKLIKDAVFVNIYDPYNILMLLTMDILTPDLKNKIMERYGIQGRDIRTLVFDAVKQYAGKPTEIENLKNSNPQMFAQLQRIYEPFQRFFLDVYAQNMHRHTLRGNNYEIPRELLKFFNKMGYAGFVNPLTLHTTGRDIGNPRFSEIVFAKTVFEYVKRDFSNKYDWQYFDTTRLFGEFGKLILDMQKYKTANINTHQGDLYQHSVWTALYIQEQFVKKTVLVEHINEQSKNALIITGFLHDIGKAGDNILMFYDKPDHPKKGSDYILEKTGGGTYKFEDNQVLNVNTMLTDAGLTTDTNTKQIIAFLIRSHWDFGNILNEIQRRLPRGTPLPRLNDNSPHMNELVDRFVNEYINKLKEHLEYVRINIVSENDFLIAVNMAMLVSICDIMAMSVYVDSDKFQNVLSQLNTNPEMVIDTLNSYLTDYPFIVNQPQIHRGGNTISYNKSGENLLFIRKKVLNKLKNINSDMDLTY
jgi:tRNA A-37 threonylcarbamoyl transferase component Bud32